MVFTALGFVIPAAMGEQEGRKLLPALNFDLGFTLGFSSWGPTAWAAPHPVSLLALPGPGGGLAGEAKPPK
jgi:hypothetical protein